MQFVDVLLPLPLPTTYTYSVPQECAGRVAVGCRVVVPLGKSKKYTALIMAVHDRAPEGYEVRPFAELLDEAPILLPSQLKLWEWI
ncbi:MAG: primosomal protein N', partial [Bacteroidaceae bacterium]|nr:primosomal protein N' [Bacteroidaceae bacterium]